MVAALETKDLPPLFKQLLSVTSRDLYGKLSRKENVLSTVGKEILLDMATCLSHTDRGKELASLPHTTAQIPVSKLATCIHDMRSLNWVMNSVCNSSLLAAISSSLPLLCNALLLGDDRQGEVYLIAAIPGVDTEPLRYSFPVIM